MLFHPFSDRPFGSEWNESKKLSTLGELPQKKLIFSDQYNVARIVINCEEFIELYNGECTAEDTDDILLLDVIRTLMNDTDEIQVDDIIKGLDAVHTFTLDEVKLYCLKTGRVALYDISKRNYVHEYIFQDSGSLEGPLAGRGSYGYYITGDKKEVIRLFLGGSWVT